MKLLKGFLFALVGLFMVVTAISLLMPSRVLTSRTVMIDASPGEIMQQLQNLSNWKNWHPVFMHDPHIKVQGTQPIGSFAEWGGNKKNRLVITGITSTSVRFDLESEGEKTQMNKLQLHSFPGKNGVEVEWSALTTLRWYPWEKFSGIFIDKMTGPGYETALQSLKELLEKPVPPVTPAG